MTIVVGAFEAKTKLSALLQRVKAGEEVRITHRGKEIARLVPPPKLNDIDVEKLRAIADRFSALVKGEFSSADINDILYDEDGLPK